MQAPDPEHIYQDEEGNTFLHWVASYEIDGMAYTTMFWAEDWEDAEQHIKARTLELDGQVLSTAGRIQ